MKQNLNLKQAEIMLEYLKNSIGKDISNFEILCGLILCFSFNYLEMIVTEFKRQQVDLNK